jgi:UDP-N-acetylglucosamine--N-acetylmuramyl-(pentapeptide) pyrophosphoryl-undecaprenol N-acetylglucosamine transferase
MFRPSFIWEPNAYPGLANRWLAPWVKQCLVVFAEAARHLKSKRVLQVGMPVRASIIQVNQSPVESWAKPEEKPLRVLVFGGSQGSRAINRVITAFIAERGDTLKNIEWVHQTGEKDFEETAEKYRQLQVAVDVQAFLYDMDYRYRWADLVIARAGTGTVSELAACGKAAILVPFPQAADDHQQKNAEALAQTGAAIMILQKDFTSGRLREVLSELLAHRDVLKRLGENIQRFHRPQADMEIAEILLGESK